MQTSNLPAEAKRDLLEDEVEEEEEDDDNEDDDDEEDDDDDGDGEDEQEASYIADEETMARVLTSRFCFTNARGKHNRSIGSYILSTLRKMRTDAKKHARRKHRVSFFFPLYIYIFISYYMHFLFLYYYYYIYFSLYIYIYFDSFRDGQRFSEA